MAAFASDINTNRADRAVRGTLIAGLMQAAVALAILFLPIMPASCSGIAGGNICPRLPYLQMEGSLLGYAYLLAMVGIGIGAVVLATGKFAEYACPFRWTAVLISLSFTVLGVWSMGLMFLPGGVLMLIAAISCLNKRH